MSTIYVLKLSSRKLALFWIFCSIFDPRTFLEGRCHLQNCKFGDYSVTFSNGFKAAVVGTGHKEAAFLHSQIWVLGQQSLNGSGVVVCKLEWNVPGKSPLSLCLITSGSYFYLKFYFLSQQICLQCFVCSRCARCGSFTHIHISILLHILFPCRLCHNVE